MKKGIALNRLVGLLDTTLKPEAFRDDSHNGLQVANSGRVARVVTGVDASLRLLETAAALGAQCVVCHHGLSWGSSLARIVGLNHRLLAFALSNDIAVYASHLPLDAHPRYGNNAQLARALGLTRLKPAFPYHGTPIGLVGTLPEALAFDAFVERVRRAVSPAIRALAFGRTHVRSVGVVSGGASDMAATAAELGVDVFLTGEPSLQGYVLAENLAQPVLYAGHYATETFGVRALARLITSRLALPATFVDFDLPY